jgi:phage gpG-like protein
MGFRIKVDVSGAVSALRRMKEQLPDANNRAVDEMAKHGIRLIQTKLASGSPLRVRSGDLLGSVEQTLTEPGGLVSRARIAPTVVYSRIQELGGVSGKGHKSKLPPRPYVAPSIEAGMDEFRDDAINAMRAVFG